MTIFFIPGNKVGATAALRERLRDLRPPATPAPRARAASVGERRASPPKASTENGPWKDVSCITKIPAHHTREAEPMWLVDSETRTGPPRMDPQDPVRGTGGTVRRCLCGSPPAPPRQRSAFEESTESSSFQLPQKRRHRRSRRERRTRRSLQPKAFAPRADDLDDRPGPGFRRVHHLVRDLDEWLRPMLCCGYAPLKTLDAEAERARDRACTLDAGHGYRFVPKCRRDVSTRTAVLLAPTRQLGLNGLYGWGKRGLFPKSGHHPTLPTRSRRRPASLRKAHRRRPGRRRGHGTALRICCGARTTKPIGFDGLKWRTRQPACTRSEGRALHGGPSRRRAPGVDDYNPPLVARRCVGWPAGDSGCPLAAHPCHLRAPNSRTLGDRTTPRTHHLARRMKHRRPHATGGCRRRSSATR